MIADVSFSCIDLIQFFRIRVSGDKLSDGMLHPLGLVASKVGVTPVAWPGAISTNLRNTLISSSNRRA